MRLLIFVTIKNILLYSIMHPNPLSLVLTSNNFRIGLPISISLISFTTLSKEQAIYKAHLNTPFSMDTFERFPICHRQVLQPGPCSLAPYSGSLASLSSPISQHSFHLTRLTGNTAQSIQFHRYIPLPRKSPTIRLILYFLDTLFPNTFPSLWRKTLFLYAFKVHLPLG